LETILQSIEIDLPVHRIYAQSAHFEEFPRFMQGVKPDERVALESEDGDYVAGIVTFEPIGTSAPGLT
jgi:hypothetical protein